MHGRVKGNIMKRDFVKGVLRMRRKEREMPEEFALYVADKCIYASIATINEDNTPYNIPVSIARDDKFIYFHCAHDGKKTDNLKRIPDVCLACVGDTHVPDNEFSLEYESAVISGRASEVVDDKEKIRALRMICERHTPNYMSHFDGEVAKSLARTSVWKIGIVSATGKRKKYDREGKEMKFGRME